jgi:outer membrane protein OmpA-like peptidoglycan-associated protein
MKRYFIKLLLVFVLLNASVSFAQVKTKFELGKDLYERLAYSEAIPVLEDYLKKKEDTDAMIVLADCYRQNNMYNKAERWYAKVVADKNMKDATQYLYYAQLLQTNGKYEEAAKWYNAYLSKFPNDRRAKNQFDACTSPEKLNAKISKEFTVEKLLFNTNGYDFGACISNNKFIYTSTGGKSKDGAKVNSWTGEPFMDLYSIAMDEKGNMAQTKKKWGVGINTKYNEGPLCFSTVTGKVYFTRNNYNPDIRKEKKLTYSDDREANLKIYEANAKNDSMWADVKQLPFNDKDYSCGHPAISSDGNTLYFASNMPGGSGGTDLWKVNKIGESWGKPINLGTAVNTEGDEMFPFLDENGMLYFSSDGLPGYGGLDMFAFALKADSAAEPENLGMPFNSGYDDFAYLKDKSGNFGFFSSNRPGGAGEDDIYKFVNDNYTLEILVVDKETQLPVKDATVSLSRNQELLESFSTPEDGKASAKVSADSTYAVLADALQYLPDSTEKFIEKDETQRIQTVKLQLIPLQMQIEIIDAVTKGPIPNAMVTIKSSCLTEPKILTTNDNGLTSIRALNNCDYNLLANAKGYVPNSKDVQIRNLKGNYKVVIELKPIDDKPIALNNIYYDFDKWYIRSDAEPDLNFLLLFLNTNPEAKIELSSHTDSRGDDDYNKKLSQKRAEAAVNWLIAKGISSARMKAVGYGETKPVNNCLNNIQCSEEEHQKNRRTEFKVLNAGQVTTSSPKKEIKVDPCLNCPF